MAHYSNGGDTEVVDDGASMGEDDLQATMHALLTDAILLQDTELSPFRAEADRMYKGEPFGNEEEGRSKVVMTIVRDTVRAILPSLMRPFFSADRFVEWEPQRADQVEIAEQMTHYITEVVLQQDNNGFMQFHAAFKDALLKRIGIWKWWHEDNEQRETLIKRMASMEEVALLRRDPEIEIEEMNPADLTKSIPGAPQLYDVTYVRVRSRGKTRFAALPPEEFLISRNSRDVDTAMLVGHRTEKSTAELIAMGIDEDVIAEHGGKDTELSQNPEERERQESAVDTDVADALPEGAAAGPHLYIESWVWLADEAKKPALRKVCTLGPAHHIVTDEPAHERPFALLIPDPEPHTTTGQGVYDYTQDLQMIVSMVVRSMNDSLALSLHPRMGYVEGDVSLADLQNTAIGAPIRMQKPGALQEITHTFVGREALPVLEFFNDVLEKRVGVARAAALDPDALQSTTKSAVAAAVGAAQLQIEMIARIFAETGVRQLMNGLLRTVIDYPPVERMTRLRGQWIPVDPRSWDAGLDLRVNVGLGSGLIEERYAVLAETAAKQEQALQLMGVGDNPLVHVSQLRTTYVKMLELRGRKDAESFWKEVDPEWAPPPKDPAAEDPNMLVAKAEVQRAETDLASKTAKAQLDIEKAKVEEARRAVDLELQREEMELTDERERDKIEAEIALKLAELEMKYKGQTDIAALKAQLEREREERKAEAEKRTRRVKLARGVDGQYEVTEEIEEHGDQE